MATGNTNYSTLITTTLQNLSSEIFDSVSTNNAVYWLLNKSGNIKIVGGGRTFTHPLLYKVNPTFKTYSQNAPIDRIATDSATRAEFPIRVVAGSISLSTLELAMNAGNKEKLIDLVTEKKLEAEISMKEVMGDQMFGAGTAPDFGGLPFLINTSPSTQTDVGGIDASATGNDYWRNQVDISGVTAFNTASEGQIAMRSLLMNCTFGTQGPNVIVTTKTVYNLYETGLTQNARYTNMELGDAGFKNVVFETLPVIFDDNCTAGTMYFVDTDALWLQVLSQGNMENTPFTLETDQLASSSLMYLFGNLTCGSRRTQGLMNGITV